MYSAIELQNRHDAYENPIALGMSRLLAIPVPLSHCAGLHLIKPPAPSNALGHSVSARIVA